MHEENTFSFNLMYVFDVRRNQQQLDTLRRMGIETVGQLASASTIVGKSIPVGDNRLTRLRNALKVG